MSENLGDFGAKNGEIAAQNLAQNGGENGANGAKTALVGVVKAVCISVKKGTQKRAVEQARLIAGHGIDGDAHAGKWHRQVSFLSGDRVEEFKARGAKVGDGAFGENLVVDGIDFKSLPVGSIIRVGGADLGGAGLPNSNLNNVGGGGENLNLGSAGANSSNSNLNNVSGGGESGADLGDKTSAKTAASPDGCAVLRMTQIGKECHSHCAIFHQVGDCIMPREGVFAEVLRGGIVRAGDILRVELP